MKKVLLFAFVLLIVALCFCAVACGETTDAPTIINGTGTNSGYGNNGTSAVNNGGTDQSGNGSGNTSTVNNGGTESTTPSPSHTHTYSAAWAHDADYHWHDATCGHDVVSAKVAHVWQVTYSLPATETTTGLMFYTCGTCGATKSETIPATGTATTEPVEQGDFVFKEYLNGYTLTAYRGSDSVVTVPSTYKSKPVLAIGIYNDTDINGSAAPSSYDLTQNAGFYHNTTITKVVLPETITTIGAYAFCECSNLREINIPSGCQYIYGYAFKRTVLRSLTIPAAFRFISGKEILGDTLVESVRIEGGVNFSGMVIASFFSSLQTVEFELKESELDYHFDMDDNVDMAYGGDVWYNLRDNGRWFIKNGVQYYMYGNYVTDTNKETYKTYFDGSPITIYTYKPCKIRGNCYKLPSSFKTLYVSTQATNVNAMVGNATQFKVEYYDAATTTSRITYDYAGGTGTNNTTYSFADGYTLNAPTRAGYTFLGWTGSNGNTPQKNVTIPKNTLGDKSYKANWQIAQYTITYVLNGGSVSGSNPTSFTAETSSFSLANPTRTGYTFLGWTGANGTTPQTSVRVNTQSGQNLTYTANWQAVQYTITYQLDGGTNDSRNPTSYTIERGTITLFAATRTSYNFDGWLVDGKASNVIDCTICKNIVISAKWLAEMDISIQGADVVLLTYKGSSSVVDIPANVTKIGDKAFENHSEITSVTIGNGVTSIGYLAFAGCRGLTSISIPNSVTTIRDRAFYNCSKLTSITIPDSASIDSDTFYNCSGLKSIMGSAWAVSKIAKACGSGAFSVSITSGTSIYREAFKGCSGLTSISIPNSATSIEDGAFAGCSGLTSITIPDSVTSIGQNAFSGCSGLTAVTIGNSVTSIDYYAFNNCNNIAKISYAGEMTSWCGISGLIFLMGYGKSNKSLYINGTLIKGALVIPDSVTSIGGSAFYGCSGLTSVTIPNSVTSIGGGAFYGCSGLTSVTIPNSVTTIGSSAFYGCSGLTSVTIPNSVTTIAGSAFYNCSGLTSVTIGISVTSIGDYAFYGCAKLTSITIPKSVTSINEYAFWACTGLKTIMGSAGAVSKIAKGCGSGAFSVSITAGTSIYSNSFKDCSKMTSVAIGNSVTSIGDDAFKGCSGLLSVTIGKSVTSIGYRAFSGSSKLTSITVASDNPTYHSKGNCIIESATNILVVGCTNSIIPNDVTSIRDCAFYEYSSLTSVTIPNSVTTIGSYAFAYCSGLTSVTIPNSVTAIGNSAFYGCSSLIYNIYNNAKYLGNETNPYVVLIEASDKSITACSIHQDTKLIQERAFYKCSKLTSIIIPEGVTSIGDSAFDGCSELTSVTIPDSVTFIGTSWLANCNRVGYNIYNNAKYLGNETNPYVVLIKASDKSITACSIHQDTKLIQEYAFSECSNLTSVTIGGNVTTIGSCAFYECSKLTSIIIPEGVTSIGAAAFEDCSGLASITIPSSVTTIGSSAFYGCSKLTSIIIPNSVTSIGERAFCGCSGLTSIIVPNSVTTIGNYAFHGCSGLTSITVAEGNSVYHSANNCIICTAKKVLVVGCKTSVIPTDGSVTSIGKGAFGGCGLNSITIPNSVTSIGEGAFAGCKGLTSISIPNSVTSIGERAFQVCSGLTSIRFQGTKAQWNAIGKYSSWNDNTGNYTVHCTDGNISK